MVNYTAIIAKYINGELSEAGKATFENDLKTNVDLKKEYELQLKIVEGAKRLGLKNQISSSFKTVKTNKLIKNTLVGLAITIAVIGAIVLVKKAIDKNLSQVLHELNEQGNTNWAEADKTIESQIYTLNPLRDTIIETRQGIVFSIPANAFLNKNGQTPDHSIDIEIKEAMTASEIMKAGLNTMSNGKLLETGGMFYVNARDGEENLSIDKSRLINANVPVNYNKKDMMLFKGERKFDGGINWINPKPMKKKLTTLEISKLDFYPEHFLDTLKEMGFDIKNKKLTDSIYYSFSGNCHFETQNKSPFNEFELNDKVSLIITDSSSFINTGERLFKQNCGVCHTMSKDKLTGPGLAGLFNRVPKDDWLKKYIINNNKLISSGDLYANKLVKDNGGADGMPEFEYLSDEDLNNLIKYITGNESWTINNINSECEEINPARIKAVWNKKFNHTILATTEFEERLKVIFSTCNASVLDLYVKNLGKNLYEIDSLAATLLSGDLKNKFLEFASRGNGGVEITDKQSQKLNAYFEEKRILYAKAVNETMEKMYRAEHEQNTNANDKRNKQAIENSIRISKTFTEELEINMTEAYRQLGKKRPEADPSSNYISADIVSMGWNNVDRYVIESTVNRTTLNYTDPESDKKAVIKYEPITITVNNFKDYDKVISYMIPDKLSSFQLMKSNTNGFKETLNELLNYSIVTIGFKGNSTFYNEIKSAKAQGYSLNLKAIKNKDLDKKLDDGFSLNKQQDLLKDIDYQLFEIKETKRHKQIQKREEIRERLISIVFHCALRPAFSADYFDIEEK